MQYSIRRRARVIAPAGFRSWIRGTAYLGLACALLALTAPRALAQEDVIAGVIVDQNGRPVPGAQIVVVGTNRGTLTGANGAFRFAGVGPGAVTIQVVVLGYRSETRQLSAGQTDVRIELTESAITLDQLVVTGTAGGEQKRAIGTTIATIDAAAARETAPITTVQDLLNGRAAGVVVVPGSGTVGSGARIRVRGLSSLSLRQEPLIYVDGVRVNNDQATGPINQAFGSRVISRWNDFAPSEIESIEIIKGPAAATLYGTEASNGVIQIITKRGVEGTARFNLTTRQGANWFANPQGRLWDNWGVGPSGDTTFINYNQLEDLNGEIFRTGRLQEYALNVSGGTAAVRYFVSGAFERNEGVEPTNQTEKFNGRANLQFEARENLDVSASLGYVNSRIDLPLEAGGGGTTWTTYYMNPARLNTPRNGFHSATPAGYYHAYEDWQDLDRFTGSVQINHRPNSWFTHRLTGGTDITRQEDAELVQRIEDPDMQFFFSPGEIRGYLESWQRNINHRTLDYSATARAQATPSISSNSSVGLQYYRRYSEFNYVYGEDFPARGLRAIDATSGSRSSNHDYVENTTVGVFAQQVFGLHDRLFLTGAIRADDNSAFGENFDLVYYPKVSVAWVLSEEPFFNIPRIGALKLRAAYGESGQQPESFAALRTFQPIPGPGEISAVSPSSLGNPDLGPERGHEVELGFDASFLNERLGLEFTYYNQWTTDAILDKDVAPSTGFGGNTTANRQFINAGEISNKGIELLARATPIRGNSLTWDVSFSLATNDNKIDDLGIEGVTFVSAGTFLQHREGFPVGAWFEKRVVNADFNANGRLVAGSEICDNGSGGTVACADAPVVYLGRPMPKTEGSVTSSFTLMDKLRLSALVDFKSGFHKLDGNLRVRCVLFFRCFENFYPAQALAEGADPGWIAQTQRGGAFVNDLIRDAGFTKLREVSASYTLPQSVSARIGASSAAITLAGRNLHTWSDYMKGRNRGVEPEASFLGGTRGGASATWEQNTTPQLTQFIASLSVNF
jgi:TonB-dependent SusC/RagA subfamily outer membrane receptor